MRSADRFPPCLLSRLTDSEPQLKKEKLPQVLSLEQLKQDVLRNLEMILNSRSHLPEQEMQPYPDAASSVLAFGLADFCGFSHDETALERIQTDILFQIRCFEPRIQPDSLDVSFAEQQSSAQEVALQISGKLRVTPLQEEFLFISRLNLETGSATIEPK